MGRPKGSKNTPKAPKPQQERIPGTERPDAIPAIETKALALLKIRIKWQEAGRAMMAAQEDLKTELKQHGLTVYHCDAEDLDVELTVTKEKVKVKRREAEESAE